MTQRERENVAFIARALRAMSINRGVLPEEDEETLKSISEELSPGSTTTDRDAALCLGYWNIEEFHPTPCVRARCSACGYAIDYAKKPSKYPDWCPKCYVTMETDF